MTCIYQSMLVARIVVVVRNSSSHLINVTIIFLQTYINIFADFIGNQKTKTKKSAHQHPCPPSSSPSRAAPNLINALPSEQPITSTQGPSFNHNGQQSQHSSSTASPLFSNASDDDSYSSSSLLSDSAGIEDEDGHSSEEDEVCFYSWVYLLKSCTCST
jgi:hypothetical protein